MGTTTTTTTTTTTRRPTTTTTTTTWATTRRTTRPTTRPTTTEPLRELEFNSFDVVVPSSSPAAPLVSTQGIQPAFKPASPSTPKFANPLVPAIIPTTGPLRIPDSSLPVAPSVDLSTSQQPAV